MNRVFSKAHSLTLKILKKIIGEELSKIVKPIKKYHEMKINFFSKKSSNLYKKIKICKKFIPELEMF